MEIIYWIISLQWSGLKSQLFESIDKFNYRHFYITKKLDQHLCKVQFFFEGVKKIGVYTCIYYTFPYTMQKHLLSYLIVCDTLKTCPKKTSTQVCLDESRILITHHIHPPRFNNSLLKKIQWWLEKLSFHFGMMKNFQGANWLAFFFELPGGG